MLYKLAQASQYTVFEIFIDVQVGQPRLSFFYLFESVGGLVLLFPRLHKVEKRI